MLYNIDWSFLNFSAQVSVFNGDGTVAVSHAGIEMGQGINTKVQIRARIPGMHASLCLFGGFQKHAFRI